MFPDFFKETNSLVFVGFTGLSEAFKELKRRELWWKTCRLVFNKRMNKIKGKNTGDFTIFIFRKNFDEFFFCSLTHRKDPQGEKMSLKNPKYFELIRAIPRSFLLT